MARLRNVATGAVVGCSDETAKHLGSGWVPVESEQPAPAEQPKRRGRPPKTDKS